MREVITKLINKYIIMRLVKFENGKYGIRVGSWFNGYTFKDLVSLDHTWEIGSKYFKDCLGSYEDCEKILNKLKYKVIR